MSFLVPSCPASRGATSRRSSWTSGKELTFDSSTALTWGQVGLDTPRDLTPDPL